MLDKVTKRKTTSTTSPLMSSANATGPASKVAGPVADAVKAQLRHLFNTF
jgi:hypothetical protein